MRMRIASALHEGCNAYKRRDMPSTTISVTSVKMAFVSYSEIVKRKPIKIRQVYSYNLDFEFKIISKIIDQYPYIAMDTEFPGFVHRHVPGAPIFLSDPTCLRYHYVRSNVNDLKLIQAGLTFSDANGNLPVIDGSFAIWEFNFKFCLRNDLYAPDSMKLLMKTNIDFDMNSRHGIDPAIFGHLMVRNNVVLNESVKWVTFHGAYDFGYLLKAIHGRDLPEDFEEFLSLITAYFGSMVFDVKYLMRFCRGLSGGLEQLAGSLDVKRAAGICHEAASDSLLTLHAFLKLKKVYFPEGVDDYAGYVYGV